MSITLKPLIWKNIDKSDHDDIWPKKCYGASLLYLEDTYQYYLIGGNHNAYENEKKNYELNKEIIKTADNINLFNRVEKEKIDYITDNVSRNYYSDYKIDLYLYDLEPDPHWLKIPTKGKTPKPRSFQRCIYISPYIFLFGGVELGPKSENLSNDSMYVYHTTKYEWKLISTNIAPYNRTDFQWVKIDNKCSFLYGGVQSPSEKYYEDMWMFRYDGSNYFETEVNKDVIKDNIWVEIDQQGRTPGKLKAYSMIYHQGYLYLFGGLDNKGKNSNKLYSFDIKSSEWELIQTKGNPPDERCYHEMSLINEETIVVFGGIKGTLNNYEIMYNDLFLYNINDKVWVTPKIGGIQPSPRMGFSICCNYGITKEGFSNEYEVMILGGYIKDNDGYTDKLKNYVKIFIIRENDENNNYFWTIKDKNYTEEENDDNFLLQAEKNIYEYREKISNLEVDTRTKELENEKMKKEINEYKKNFYQKHGFIDDQSQSLEDQINDQEMQKNKMKENLEIDKEITDLKIKLKYIMEKKTEKTCDFFNETSGIFMNYYDAVCKIINNDKDGELSDFFSNSSLDEMKEKYSEKLNNLKKKLEEFNTKEDQIVTELHRYPQYEKSLSDAFKNEIINYRIIDDTQY